MAKFASRLKQLRTTRGLTQKELGEVLNVSQNAIYNWETGHREPNIDIIEQIATFFGVSASYLMGWNENKSQQTSYYLNDDAKDLAQFLYENPDYKVLFDASRKINKNDIEFVKEMLDRFKQHE